MYAYFKLRIHELTPEFLAMLKQNFSEQDVEFTVHVRQAHRDETTRILENPLQKEHIDRAVAHIEHYIQTKQGEMIVFQNIEQLKNALNNI